MVTFRLMGSSGFIWTFAVKRCGLWWTERDGSRITVFVLYAGRWLLQRPIRAVQWPDPCTKPSVWASSLSWTGRLTPSSSSWSSNTSSVKRTSSRCWDNLCSSRALCGTAKENSSRWKATGSPKEIYRQMNPQVYQPINAINRIINVFFFLNFSIWVLIN